MVIVCSRYTEDTEQLLETIKNTGLNMEVLVWKDDGFLPEGVQSPWESVVAAQCRTKGEKKNLFMRFCLCRTAGRSVRKGSTVQF